MYVHSSRPGPVDLRLCARQTSNSKQVRQTYSLYLYVYHRQTFISISISISDRHLYISDKQYLQHLIQNRYTVF